MSDQYDPHRPWKRGSGSVDLGNIAFHVLILIPILLSLDQKFELLND